MKAVSWGSVRSLWSRKEVGGAKSRAVCHRILPVTCLSLFCALTASSKARRGTDKGPLHLQSGKYRELLSLLSFGFAR